MVDHLLNVEINGSLSEVIIVCTVLPESNHQPDYVVSIRLKTVGCCKDVTIVNKSCAAKPEWISPVISTSQQSDPGPFSNICVSSSNNERNEFALSRTTFSRIPQPGRF